MQAQNNQVYLLHAQLNTESFQYFPTILVQEPFMHKCQITVCFQAWASEYNFGFPINNKMCSKPAIYLRSIHKFQSCLKLLSERLIHEL